MKIISRFKDFYDYVAGYDTDPRKVYVRTEDIYHVADSTHPKLVSTIVRNGSENLYFIGQIWFCDQDIRYMKDIATGTHYYNYSDIPDEMILEINKLLRANRQWTTIEKEMNVPDKVVKKRFKKWMGGRFVYSIKPHLVQEPIKVNTVFGEPIYFSQYDGSSDQSVINGRLSDIRFAEYKSPQDTFTELYNWIPFIEPDMPSDPTDMIRFEGKGFDKKISFRNIK